MGKIRIKYFGPIEEGFSDNGGWMDIKKVTVFIGNQGSGKSTIAKLISTFTWIEKALARSDYEKEWFQADNRFRDHFLAYHRIENYLCESSQIDYEGEAYTISYKQGKLTIGEIKDRYPLPQIMYVPAERNFLAYVGKPNELKLSSASLLEFLTEFDNAKNAIKGTVTLPVNNVYLEYDNQMDILNLKGTDYQVKLTESSSGFQALVPLFIVTRYLAESIKTGSDISSEMNVKERVKFKEAVTSIWADKTLTEEQRRLALSALSAKFNKTAFINIVEEPEQNLFPSSQRCMLNSLLEYANLNDNNKLIITTHSPYMINFLSIAIQGADLKKRILNSSQPGKILKKLNAVMPEKSVIAAEEVVVYQLNEINGCIDKLPAPLGIPSDKNYLNDMLRQGNELFDQLLEIEEEL